MIDWITCQVPFCDPVESDALRGAIASISADGEIEWLRPRWAKVPGSYSETIQCRSTGGTFLEVSGNPLKFLQGHNLFGSSDLRGLLYVVAERIAGILEVPVSDLERWGWREGYIMLSRVDCTEMAEFPTRADCRAVARHAREYARTRHGATVVRGDTVYLNDKSRWYKLKLYVKADELESAKKGHALKITGEQGELLSGWAENKLRLELELHSRELEKQGIRMARSWTEETGMEQLQMKLEGIQMGELTELPSELLSSLPGRLVSVYRAWQYGDDLRALYSKNTFYRYRRELLQYGIDISIKCPAVPEANNVVPFGRLLDGRLATVPDWARGTPLYFEPATEERCLVAS